MGGRIEAIKIAERLSVTPPFEDLGATHKPLKAARHPQMPHSPSESPRHFAALWDESVIVGYYTSRRKCIPGPSRLPHNGKELICMARNDGVDRTFARNQDLPTLDDVAKVQEHNEREKDSYSNQDIDTTQTYRNIHFKAPTDSYAAMFDQMIADGVISTRGLKADAVKYGELIFDVNSAYFHNHGGYEYAKQFYTDAYKAAVEIVGGEQYILSAVMNATGPCRKLWGRMRITTTFTWSISRWWKNRFSGQSGARTSPLWAQSRRPSCRSAAVKSGNPR